MGKGGDRWRAHALGGARAILQELHARQLAGCWSPNLGGDWDGGETGKGARIGCRRFGWVVAGQEGINRREAATIYTWERKECQWRGGLRA